MRAVLVFCEGTHDVVFVERSLGACASCQRVTRPMRDLPSPFGAGHTVPKGLIAQRLDDCAVEELALQDSYPPTPQFESVVEVPEQDMMFVLVSGRQGQCGGGLEAHYPTHRRPNERRRFRRNGTCCSLLVRCGRRGAERNRFRIPGCLRTVLRRPRRCGARTVVGDQNHTRRPLCLPRRRRRNRHSGTPCCADGRRGVA